MTETTIQPVTYEEAGDERTTLLSTIDRIRGTFAWKCGGLDAAATDTTLGPSTLTLGGLLKHMALLEDHYFTSMFAGRTMPEIWHSYEGDDWEWRTAKDDSPEQLMAWWKEAVNRSRAVIAEGDLDALAQKPSHWGGTLSLRRIIADLIEEYARHTGHADLIRESIDGLVGEDPPES